jgi:hypothetical protein
VTTMRETHRYVVCVENSGYPASLDVRKLYVVLDDDSADAEGLVRVIDESGEDYLYPTRFFVPIELPRAVEKAFSKKSA